jgi:hypothetical protein
MLKRVKNYWLMILWIPALMLYPATIAEILPFGVCPTRNPTKENHGENSTFCNVTVEIKSEKKPVCQDDY